MKVANDTILGILGNEHVKLVVPPYQRRYAWQERQCRELWLDIMRAARKDIAHFSGTVLYKEEDDDDRGLRKLVIVDGQQRVTTVTLILIALRNHLKCAGAMASGLNADDIDRAYLKLDADRETPKLELSRLDARSMDDAVAGAEAAKIASRNISRNLAYFESLMDAEGFDADALMRGLLKLEVVLVGLDDEDDEQAVFESLNSKGKQLHIGDMVRNYLLGAETHEQQTRYYIDYWTVIEGVFEPDPGSLKMDTMVKAWLSIRFPKVRARKPEDVYSAFKQFYDDEYQGDLEPVLAELRSFSMVWAENYRYHAVKKFKSMPWAQLGAQTLVSDRELKKADNEEYAERVRAELRAMGREL